MRYAPPPTSAKPRQPPRPRPARRPPRRVSPPVTHPTPRYAAHVRTETKSHSHAHQTHVTHSATKPSPSANFYMPANPANVRPRHALTARRADNVSRRRRIAPRHEAPRAKDPFQRRTYDPRGADPLGRPRL